MNVDEIIKRLQALGDPENVKGMARYGIRSAKAFGNRTPDLRRLAREIGPNQELAIALWSRPILETRALAGMIAEPAKFTPELADEWASEFDNWAICDGTCFNIFFKTEFAYRKCFEWAEREEEFVRRAGFALMAKLAISHKDRPDRDFEAFYPVIRKHATDSRNFVKKAVNWALRQIGKRNPALNKSAIVLAREIASFDSSAARWIAADALRELESDAVQKRLKSK